MALYHLTKGSVDYTVVGSPTIENGIASGFSTNDYLQLSSGIDYSLPFQVQFKVKAIYDESRPTAYIFDNLAAFKGIASYLSSGSRINILGSTNGTSWDIQQAAVVSDIFEKDYYFRFTYIPSVSIIVEKSTDGINFSNLFTTGISGNIQDPNKNLVIGLGKHFNSNPFNGSIDLNHTYITVNGQPWFGNAPIEVKSHQIKGQVGYTVVGSPTITDGVASNLSNGENYLQLTQQPPSVINSFEFVCRCNCGSTTRGTFAYSSPTGYYRYGGFYCRTATRESSSTPPFWRYKAQQTSSEESHALTCPANSGLANSANDLVYSKLTMETVGENDYLYSFYQSLDGVTWTLLASQHDTYRMSGDDIGLITMTWNPNDGVGNTLYYARSIDLNNTYIKINGQLWFYQPRPTEYVVKDGYLVWANPKLYLTGPVNYEVVGSPTITDGVASGFSDSDCLQLDSSFAPSSTWEIATKINIGTIGMYYFVGGNGHNIVLGTTREGANYYFKVFFSSNNSSWNIGSITGGEQLQSNTTKFVKCGFDGTKYYLESSDDGVTVNDRKELSSTASIVSSVLTLGKGFGTNQYFTGSLDLNNTYIKVDNQLWFYGKNYATQNIAPVPANYTYGNTTTNAIGYVDMRTQAFHEAPAGTTIEKES